MGTKLHTYLRCVTNALPLLGELIAPQLALALQFRQPRLFGQDFIFSLLHGL